MKKLFILALISLFYTGAIAQTGTLAGTINDGEFNDVLSFANVIVKGSATGTTSDFEGRYNLELEAGTYTIVYSFVGYQTQEITGVEIKAGQTTNVSVTLNPSAANLDEVVITTSVRQNTESAVLSFQKNSVNLLDGLSIESIKRTGASNVASAVRQVPGVSVQGGKFVYVRGLGDRYTKSILNGVDIPGLDPDRNTLQLDIFPTQIIDNVIVVKSFTADQPADFTGGVVDIVTKDIPSREEYSASVGVGYNPDFHFQSDYLSDERSGTDFLGFDDGLRKDPISSQQIIPLAAGASNSELQVLRQLTQRLNPNLAAQTTTSGADFNFSFTGGNQYNIGDSKLGFLASLSYRNETESYDDFVNGQIFERVDEDASIFELAPQRTLAGSLGRNNATVSGLAGLSLKTEKSKYRLNFLHIQNGESTASQFVERNQGDANVNQIRKDNLLYTQRSISNMLLSGKHNLGENGDWNVEWKVSPTYSIIDDKDFRVTPFLIDDNDPTLLTISASEAGLPSQFFRDLEEINIAAKLGIEKKHKLFGRDAKLKFGGAYTFKWRDFAITQYAVDFTNFQTGTLNGDANAILSPDVIIDPDTDSGSFVRRDSAESDQYESEVSVIAAYISEEFKISDRINAILGVRMEKFDLTYTGVNQNGDVFNAATILDKTDFFPSANLIFDLNEDATQKIRVAYTRTTARPSFKEASSVQIVDPISNTIFNGNLDVQPSYISNYDLRYEIYGEKGDFFAVSGFYKDFTDPIEIAFFRAAPGQYQPLNLGDAKVFGGEIELRKNLGFITGFQDFSLNANVSIIESQQEFNTAERENRIAQLREGETLPDNRQLQGQSPFLINMGLNYEGEDNGWKAGLFYNTQGKTLQLVANGSFADVFTLPFHNIKFNVAKSFGENQSQTVTLRMDNLFDDVRESVFQSFRAQDQIYSRWFPGQQISLSYSVRF